MSTIASIIRYVDTNSRQSCYLVFITLILRDDGVDLVEMIKKRGTSPHEWSKRCFWESQRSTCVGHELHLAEPSSRVWFSLDFQIPNSQIGCNGQQTARILNLFSLIWQYPSNRSYKKKLARMFSTRIAQSFKQKGTSKAISPRLNNNKVLFHLFSNKN